MVNLRKPVTVITRPHREPLDPARVYGFRLLWESRQHVSLRKPVSLGKHTHRSDDRGQLYRAAAYRALRAIRAELASTGAVSLTRRMPVLAAAA